MKWECILNNTNTGLLPDEGHSTARPALNPKEKAPTLSSALTLSFPNSTSFLAH